MNSYGCHELGQCFVLEHSSTVLDTYSCGFCVFMCSFAFYLWWKLTTNFNPICLHNYCYNLYTFHCFFLFKWKRFLSHVLICAYLYLARRDFVLIHLIHTIVHMFFHGYSLLPLIKIARRALCKHCKGRFSALLTRLFVNYFPLNSRSIK